MEVDDKIQHAMQNTEVLRSPQQTLATFGSTNIYYYIITELVVNTNIVREGRVIAAKPKIVTPVYLTNLEGFSQQARRYVEIMAQKYPHELGIFYSYKNEPKEMNIVSESFNEVLDKINHRIDNQGNPLSAIIKGVEELWDVSLLKFTYELTNQRTPEVVLKSFLRKQCEIFLIHLNSLLNYAAGTCFMNIRTGSSIYLSEVEPFDY
jgi:hypothetical protein